MYKACCLVLLILNPVVNSFANNMSENEDFIWHNGLRQSHFADRSIIEAENVVSLQAPKRAEDAALVPLKINSRLPQTADLYIKTIYLIIDQNPAPLAARFHFTPQSGRADLALRVRVNAHSPIRAIAETSDGKLHMSKRFIKASGGCSAPMAGDLEAALSRLGKMKLKTLVPVLNQPTQTRINISHPNITGLQLDQVTQLYTPAHFVETVKVSFNNTLVMTAETDIAISEDPSFQFYFVPDKAGTLNIEATDNKGEVFTQSLNITPQ